MRRLLTVAAASVLLVAANVLAGEKNDIVILKNGDRITCEVKNMRRGLLKASTDDIGTLYVEWDKIESVTTATSFEVELTDGTREVGWLSAGRLDTLQVIVEDGSVKRHKFMDVVSFNPIRSGFFDRMDGSLDVGGSYTRSSGVSELSVNFDDTYRRPLFDAFLKVSSNNTSDGNGDDIFRFTVNTGYTRYRRSGLYFSPFLYAERNPGLGLTFRGLGAIAVGKYLKRSNRSFTVVAAGGAAGRERLSDGSQVNNFDALAMLTTSFYVYDYPKTNIDLSIIVFPELNRWGRVRANADAKLKRELFRDFFAALTLYDTFDSQPQVPDVSRNDIGVTLSIGWTF